MSESDIYRCLIQRDIYIDAIVFFQILGALCT